MATSESHLHDAGCHLDGHTLWGAQGHDEIVWAVEIHNQQLFSASADKTIRVWDIASKRCERVCILIGTAP